MAVLAAGALAAAMLWSIAHWTRTRAITDLAATSGHVLTLVTETLAGELAKHRSTPLLLSHNPRLIRIVRLCANEERAVDIRIIAATKDDLKTASSRGTFREDLYYRLNVLKLAIPSLRERRDDIPLLFQVFVEQAATRFKTEVPSISPAHIASLIAHDWPGNVRELQNSAVRFALGLGLEIDGQAVLIDDAVAGSASLSDQLARVERQIIADTLQTCGNSLKATYESLGISRKTLYDQMRRYRLGRLPAEDESEA
jgi:two-component system C4-dicarboxylate transport response regulator DctD